MKPGRNAPCPCGSGKKYKHCCLKADHGKTSSASAGMSGNMMDMLLDQMGFSSPEEMDVAMERYKGYCESLPKDADCLTFQEYLGKPNQATKTHKSMAAQLKGREFSSPSEAQAFMNSFMEQQNCKGMDDFEGLSPAQMHVILTGKLDANTWLFTLRENLPKPLVEKAEIVDMMRWILSYHLEAGGTVKLTSRENYPRKMCEAFLLRYDEYHHAGNSVPSEEKIPLLYLAHELLFNLNYLDETQTVSRISPEGIKLYSSEKWVSLYPEVITCMIDFQQWDEELTEELDTEHFTIIQKAAPFLIYLLYRHPSGSIDELFDRFCRAFPNYVAPAEYDSKIRDWLQVFFERLFVFQFCVPFALLDISEEMRYRTTRLFQQTFAFQV